MKKTSIKKSLPRLTKIMMLILILLILPADLWLQLTLQHHNQMESSMELFGQVEQLIESNKEILQHEEEEFKDMCIRAAEMAAYIIRQDVTALEDMDKMKEMAEKLNVEEIHFFTPQGEIVAGTDPEYYGYTLYSGEQMDFFLPMLEDRSLKLCQEITANTPEGKPMQYAAVWMEDGSGIVQIGMSPEHHLQMVNHNRLQAIFSEIPYDLRGYLHIVDASDNTVVASSDQQMVGTDMSELINEMTWEEDSVFFHSYIDGEKFCVYAKLYDEYILIRSYISFYPTMTGVISAVLVFIYMIVATIVVISIIGWYIKKRISNNLDQIVNDLKKIEEGDLENIKLHTNIAEFDELIFYINQLLKSIRLNWFKMINFVNVGNIPVGIFEFNQFYKKMFHNERLLEILGIDKNGFDDTELLKIVRHKIHEAETSLINKDEKIYRYQKKNQSVYLRIEKHTDEQSITYYITDVSVWWTELNMLKEKSYTDSLTKLYNRRGFKNIMNELFEQSENIGMGVMIVVDADGLKKVNDIYGHRAGDRYLKRIAEFIKSSVGEKAVCARFGGDEFVMFVYGFDSETEIEQMINQLKKHRGIVFISDEEQTITIEYSIGTALYPKEGNNYHILMNIADKKMYQEKLDRKR